MRRPEGGAEHELIVSLHHDCEVGRALVRELKDEDVDLLHFPVGLYGYEMPVEIPFPVQALEECGGCGRLLTAMYMWVGPKLVFV